MNQRRGFNLKDFKSGLRSVCNLICSNEVCFLMKSNKTKSNRNPSKSLFVSTKKPTRKMIRFVIYSAFVLVLILSDFIDCKSIPFDEKELDNLGDCKKPSRTSAQLVLATPGKRRLTFTQLLIRKMLRTMIRRKSLPAAFLDESPIQRRRRRRRRKPVRFRRPEFESLKTRLD